MWSFCIDVGCEKWCLGMLKDWQVQRKTQGMASIMSRLADVLRSHARRGLYMLVKPSADDSLLAVCVCLPLERWYAS